ncbi:hypothetical protein [Geomicrobium sediminis]|uniref:Phosphoglycerol transferase MdoB-like AlkP superfamily enzyme n=1 Tax=Geomicrobium sediminis TaxID=1347788 RepID=A0ABS2PBZ1_9BACL|nr:hypothetical protein [Geomicrobium sediminis]MBM7632960.1 phosphoglycerol transferase MdoB-like AlkP superfamily enzyme [Geomicrobium sediminis]
MSTKKSFFLNFSVTFFTILNVSVCLVVFVLALIGIVTGVNEIRDTAIVLMPLILVTSFLSRRRKRLEEEQSKDKESK